MDNLQKIIFIVCFFVKINFSKDKKKFWTFQNSSYFQVMCQDLESGPSKHQQRRTNNTNKSRSVHRP